MVCPAYLIYKGNAVTPVAKEIIRYKIRNRMTNHITNVVFVLSPLPKTGKVG